MISLYYLQFVVQILLTSGYGLVVCAYEKASSLKFEYCDCSIKIRILPLVHTTSNLVWLLITDYGEKLGCPCGPHGDEDGSDEDDSDCDDNDEDDGDAEW